MSLRSKILLGYSAILVLLVAMTVWSVADLRLLGRASQEILSENYRSILAAENMIDHLERQDSATLLSLLGDREGAAAQFRVHQAEFLRWLARAEDNITIEGEQAIVDSIRDGFAAYLAAFDRLIGSDVAAASPVALYRDDLHPHFERVLEACIALRELNQSTMVAASDEAAATSRRAVGSTAVVGAATALCAFLLSIILSDFLTRPLRDMSEATARVAEGDYDVHLEPSTGDELGQLARQISTMVLKLKGYHEINVGRLLEQKRLLEAILRSIPDGLVVVDERFRVTALNPAAEKVFETGLTDATGRHVLELVGDEEIYQRVKSIAGNPEPAAEPPELRLSRDRGGRTQHYRCSVTPVRGQDGGFQAIVLLLQDFTRLLEVDRLKNEFFMAASHELRTPLTGMVMSLGLLNERVGKRLDADDRELLATANQEAHRLRALVEELLDLSRLQSGRLEVEIERTTVGHLVDTALASLRSQVEAQGIALATEIAPDLPDITTDPHKMVWVLTNLLSNALRYTPRGGEIRVIARAVGDDVHLAVQDTGPGIPVDLQSRIFDRFVQLDAGRGAHGGLGIGLALSRSIVRAQGGTIWVESAPQAGSTFTFTMPAAGTARPR